MLVGWALGLTPRVNDASEVIQELTWPTGYGFVMLVMLLYPAGWAMARASERVGAWIATGCLLAWLGHGHACSSRYTTGRDSALGTLAKIYVACFLRSRIHLGRLFWPLQIKSQNRCNAMAYHRWGWQEFSTWF